MEISEMSDNTMYLIDTSFFVQAYKQYYAPEIAPSFWEKLEEKAGHIVLLDVVKNEFCKNKKGEEDWLQKWTEFNIPKMKFINLKDENNIIENHQKVLEYITSCGKFTDRKCKNWLEYTTADPWIIATGISYGYTIVSMEIPEKLDKKSKEPKIPDIAMDFDIKHINTYEFMDELGIRL